MYEIQLGVVRYSWTNTAVEAELQADLPEKKKKTGSSYFSLLRSLTSDPS